MDRKEDQWICTKCKWEGHDNEINKEIVFSATLEEPEEWEWYCPSCGSPSYLEEHDEHAIWCRTCEDEIVQHEGDQCTECATCQAEAAYDESIGH